MQRKEANAEAAKWDADGPPPTSAVDQVDKDGKNNSGKRGRRQDGEDTSHEQRRRRSSAASSHSTDDDEDGDAGRGSVSSPPKKQLEGRGTGRAKKAPTDTKPADAGSRKRRV